MIQSIASFITAGIIAVTSAAILLILLRSLFKYLDRNPFNWSVRTVGRLTDPVIHPVRRLLIGFRIEPRVAPFIAIVLIMVFGYFTFMLAENILNTIAGILYALSRPWVGAPAAIAGYVIFGFLGFYTLMIFLRILCSYLITGYPNRWVRLLFRSTEPLLAPLRRVIPTVGMFDISPIIAFVVLYLLQFVVAGTLLKGWPVRFF
ncbi:MAG TPA: YggT family protein [Pyrinomonadaceae bacterium]|nr:YggT family protein [Pyrinomonadaceae bacterium]